VEIKEPFLSLDAVSFVFTLRQKYIKINIQRTTSLPVLLDGCETWSLIFMKGNSLIVFEKRLLSEVIEPKRYTVTGERRRLPNEELYDLYYSQNTLFKRFCPMRGNVCF
jgi:hypothetical protein